jgi:hypothetical protein
MTRATFAALAILLAASIVPTQADQTARLKNVMRDKLVHSQAILGAVVTSDWPTLDRESRALVVASRDPAWVTLTAPEYLQQSDAFIAALKRLIQASAAQDLDAAGQAEMALTKSCVDCHSYLARHRRAGLR